MVSVISQNTCHFGVCISKSFSYLHFCHFSKAIFDRLRHILHESKIDMRVQYMIEVMFAVRKDGFKDHPIIPEGLDLVEEEDQFTHMLPLEDDYNPEDVLSKLEYNSMTAFPVNMNLRLSIYYFLNFAY